LSAWPDEAVEVPARLLQADCQHVQLRLDRALAIAVGDWVKLGSDSLGLIEEIQLDAAADTWWVALQVLCGQPDAGLSGVSLLPRTLAGPTLYAQLPQRLQQPGQLTVCQLSDAGLSLGPLIGRLDPMAQPILLLNEGIPEPGTSGWQIGQDLRLSVTDLPLTDFFEPLLAGYPDFLRPELYHLLASRMPATAGFLPFSQFLDAEGYFDSAARDLLLRQLNQLAKARLFAEHLEETLSPDILHQLPALAEINLLGLPVAWRGPTRRLLLSMLAQTQLPPLTLVCRFHEFSEWSLISALQDAGHAILMALPNKTTSAEMARSPYLKLLLGRDGLLLQPAPHLPLWQPVTWKKDHSRNLAMNAPASAPEALPAPPNTQVSPSAHEVVWQSPEAASSPDLLSDMEEADDSLSGWNATGFVPESPYWQAPPEEAFPRNPSDEEAAAPLWTNPNVLPGWDEEDEDASVEAPSSAALEWIEPGAEPQPAPLSGISPQQVPLAGWSATEDEVATLSQWRFDDTELEPATEEVTLQEPDEPAVQPPTAHPATSPIVVEDELTFDFSNELAHLVADMPELADALQMGGLQDLTHLSPPHDAADLPPVEPSPQVQWEPEDWETTSTEVETVSQPLEPPALEAEPLTSGSLPVESLEIPAPETEVLGFAEGDRVHHATYGPGRIMKIIPMDGRTILNVYFDQLGKRLLDPSLTHLEKG
jgi:hypothetical protein